jgi:hypothetical protein
MNGRVTKRKDTPPQSAESLLSQLETDEASLRKERGAFHLHPGPADVKASPIAEDLVRFCLQQDWLHADRDGLTLSPSGRAWLRRKRTGIRSGTSINFAQLGRGRSTAPGSPCW